MQQMHNDYTVNPNLFAFPYLLLKIPLNFSSSTCFSPSLSAAERERRLTAVNTKCDTSNL